MAIAEVIGKRVEVTLALTEEETALIYSVLANVGGNCQESPRKHSDSILRALDDIVEDNPSISRLNDRYHQVIHGTLHFDKCSDQ